MYSGGVWVWLKIKTVTVAAFDRKGLYRKAILPVQTLHGIYSNHRLFVDLIGKGISKFIAVIYIENLISAAQFLPKGFLWKKVLYKKYVNY